MCKAPGKPGEVFMKLIKKTLNLNKGLFPYHKKKNRFLLKANVDNHCIVEYFIFVNS